MPKKTRVGILEEAISRYRYRMSLHPNFGVYYKEGALVYFETIDSDGKLKRVTCSVEPITSEGSDIEIDPREERILTCEEVSSAVEERHADLISSPAAGKVVYLT